jgi:hypothetical protein
VPNEQDPTFNASASARIVDADLQNWNNKQNNLGYTAENRTNKSTNVIADAISDDKYPSVNAVKTYVDAAVTNATIVDANAITKGKIQLAGDLAGTAALPTVPGLVLKAPLASPAFTGTVTGIDKAMVGLSNVDDTADADKAISTATNTALGSKEATANKSIDVATDPASDEKYPSVKAVKTYVDGLVGTASKAVSINTNTTLDLATSIVYCSGAFTVTLPAATAAPGKIYSFSKTDDANTVLTFSESIYLTANSSFTELNYPKSFRIQSENGKWMILN